ncbi:MAG: mechanosensitive ion channel family protein, partial [Terriglobales bacterium]
DRLHTQVAAGERHERAAAVSGGGADGEVLALKQLQQEQQQISRYDEQADTAGQLADAYHQWQPVVGNQRQRALHEALRLTLILLAILAALFLLLYLWDRLLSHPRWDRKRAATLRHLLGLITELLAVLAALIVLFGRPPQILTVLGLAGAGLTVAFQDAIMSVGGWFVLMGRNGVRIGDWVEINGVVGEVLEIRLLRTVMLETGNWIAAGHPTGRRVFFPNNFALKGSYFNYSTAGQWLWDQLEVPVPSGADPHALVSRVTGALQAELQPLSERARSEWQHLHSGVGFDTAPVVYPRPGSGGTVLVVRYTTPARQRTEMREKLWNLIEAALVAPAAAAAASPGAN